MTLIVRLVPGLTSAEQADAIASGGGTEVSVIDPLRMHVVEVPGDAVDAAITAYEADPRVQSVDKDMVRAAEATPNDPAYPGQWALPQIWWDQAFGSVVPSGSATVAVLDTGVDGVGDLSLVPGYSAFGSDTSDPNGHGTWVASIAAATTDNYTGIAGVAYAGTSVMPVQVLGADGTGQDSDIINGVVWATDHGADVILMSFSNPGYSQALQDAITYAWNHGVVVVAAVGNDGSSSPTYPAGDADVVGVSATDQNDALWTGSNYGADTFIAAPGVDVAANDLTGTVSVTGTSASAAIVAGAAALVKANDPSAANDVIVGRLARNADPAGTTDQTGNGRVNLARTLADTSIEGVTPAGAPGGGPVVGPYVTASNFSTINGIVSDSVTTNAITGATVSASCAGCNGSGNVTYTGGGTSTNSTGQYSVSGFQYASSGPATITVTASAPGYTAGTGSSGTVTCSNNGNCSPSPVARDLTLTPANNASIAGTVYNDLNGNGSLDGGEVGISGVTVTLSGTSSGTTTTDGSGAFAFSALAAGTYNVTYTVPANFVNTGTRPISGIVVASGATVTGKNFFAQQRDGSISGTVYNDLNGNGSLDGGEVGISGVTITLTGGTPSVGTLTTTTNGSGAYSFSSLQAGSYSIDYTPPSGFVNTGTKPLSATLSAGGSVTGKNFFAQQRDGSISGTVYNDLNGNGSLDGGEVGISGVTI
ncbi:MAG: S8 family serine peptidase, partial [Actinobacteria bacterium]|nr:S8 family serine peptidase [Actinomycetota bacterium]